MKTVGKLLNDARTLKKYSLAKIEEETKIKVQFIKAIEKDAWGILPEYTVVLGFVKNLAEFLEVPENQAVALLRRDYLPKKENVAPKPDISDKFMWSPKLTFVTGVTLVVIMILGYLVSQYMNFIKPPRLEVVAPLANMVVKTTSLKVIGETSEDATVTVNNQPVLVGDDGKFTTDLQIYDGTREVIIKAVSRARKETVIVRQIKVEL